MRRFLIAAVALYGLACVNNKKIGTDLNPLQGRWAPVKEVIGGKNIPSAVFDKQLLTVNDSNYTFSAESVDRGVVVRAGNQLDIYGREGVNAGKHFTAIFRREQDQLYICYDLTGKGYPASFDTGTSNQRFLAVFTRVKQP